MKVNCLTVGDFTENLIGISSPSEIFQKTVWVETTYRGIDCADIRKAVKIQVFFCASAVVVGESGEYILNLGVDCGYDYKDGEQEKTGTDIMKLVKANLMEFCEKQGLKILPGSLDM